MGEREISVVAVCVINIVLLSFGWRREARYDLNRSSFPQGFIFGTASAAYQVLFSSNYFLLGFFFFLVFFLYLNNNL